VEYCALPEALTTSSKKSSPPSTHCRKLPPASDLARSTFFPVCGYRHFFKAPRKAGREVGTMFLTRTLSLSGFVNLKALPE
jgi:hypothetical protein